MLQVLKAEKSLVERIAYVSQIEQAPVMSQGQKDRTIALLFNPFDYDPSQRKNLFEHILALQQWKRLHDFRFQYFTKRQNTTLELIILIKPTNAHFSLLYQKFKNTSTWFSDFIWRHFNKAFQWDLTVETDLVVFNNSDDISLKRRVMVQDYPDVFGLPAPLRAYMLLLMREDLNSNYGDFVDAEYFLGTFQRDFLYGLDGGRKLNAIEKKIETIEIPLTNASLKEVCLAWLNYWSFLMEKLGQLNCQTGSNPLLQNAIRDCFNLGIITFLPKAHLLKAIEEDIILEGNFFIGFSVLLRKNCVADVINLTRYFVEYSRTLEQFLNTAGFHEYRKSFAVNELKVALVKNDLGNLIGQ